MNEIKHYTMTDVNGDSAPKITIECKCVITELVNKHKNKEDLIIALKSHLNKEFINPTHNFDIEVFNNKGETIYDIEIYIDKPQIVNKVKMVLPNAI